MDPLQTIQKQILDRDYESAIKSLTVLILKKELPLLLCMRALCHFELKNYPQTNKDLFLVLTHPTTKTTELLPGCYSTHISAYYLLSKSFERTNQESEQHKYARLASDEMKQQSSNEEKSIEMKELGNKLFKSGKPNHALDMYLKAIQLDPLNLAALANASKMNLVLGNLENAQVLADRCIEIDQTWAKGWFRKGSVALKKKDWSVAVYAFMNASKISSEYKGVYLDTMKLAQSKGINGVDSQFLGVLMQLQRASWDFKKWVNDVKLSVTFLSTKNNDWRTQIQVSFNDPQFKHKLKDLLKRFNLPLDSIPSIDSLFIKQDPFITLSLFHSLLSHSSKTQWSFVWSLKPFDQSNQPFGILVNKSEMIVFDCLNYLDIQSTLTQIHDPVYTCEDSLKFIEFLLSFKKIAYSNLNETSSTLKDSEMSLDSPMDSNNTSDTNDSDDSDTEPIKIPDPISNIKTINNSVTVTISRNEWILLLIIPILLVISLIWSH